MSGKEAHLAESKLIPLGEVVERSGEFPLTDRYTCCAEAEFVVRVLVSTCGRCRLTQSMLRVESSSGSLQILKLSVDVCDTTTKINFAREPCKYC